jgi:hypothetical protein
MKNKQRKKPGRGYTFRLRLLIIGRTSRSDTGQRLQCDSVEKVRSRVLCGSIIQEDFGGLR